MLAIRPIIFAALSSASLALAHAKSTTMPASAPSTDAIDTLLKGLDARDPAAREQARDGLMQLSRDDLPALAEAARARALLSPAQWSTLHDAVVHVYLAAKQGGAGLTPGFLGVTLLRPQQITAGAPTAGVLIQTRLVGYDSYRVLQVGDVITSIARGGETEFKVVESFDQLRALLARTRAGEWIQVRFLRDGAERDVALKLGPPVGPPVVDANAQSFAEGDRYWDETFKPKLKRPPPASRPAR